MADQKEPLKHYALQLLCESMTFLNSTMPTELPVEVTDTGRCTFMILDEIRPTNGSLWASKNLIFRTVLKGRSLQDAMNRANKHALLHVTFISFLMNSHVGPPRPWTIYEVGTADAWRAFRQAEWEQIPPPSLQNIRILQPDVIREFYNKFAPKNMADMPLLQRSMDLYNVALKYWNIFHTVFASHYLFIAAEGLTDLAVPIYLASKGKTEEDLIEEIIPELIAAYLPNGLKKGEKKAMRADWKVRGYPGKLIDQAKSIVKSKARREVIFDGFPDAYIALNKATNGLEHGTGDHNEFRGKAFVAQLENAAVCIRSWILHQLISDAALLTKLTSEPYRLPIMTLDAIVAVEGEFKSEHERVPTSDPCGALYQLTVHAEGRLRGEEPTVSAKPLISGDPQYRCESIVDTGNTQ